MRKYAILFHSTEFIWTTSHNFLTLSSWFTVTFMLIAMQSTFIVSLGWQSVPEHRQTYPIS